MMSLMSLSLTLASTVTATRRNATKRRVAEGFQGERLALVVNHYSFRTVDMADVAVQSFYTV